MSLPSSLPLRWLLLVASFATLWAVVYAFGRVGVPLVNGLDEQISAFINPDQPTLFFDAFFRALTDGSNVLIAAPLISLAIAIGVFRLTQMPLQRALLWAAGVEALWCAVTYLLHEFLDLKLEQLPILDAIPAALMLLGAGVPAVIRALPAQRWIGGILVVEMLLFCAAWFAHMLWWNEGLLSANYFLLPALPICFGAAAYAFHVMDDAAMTRYTRVFWLVLLTIVLVDPLATERTKSAIARPRPLNDAHSPWNKTIREIPEERLRGNNSYPSGHASGTFALLTPLFWWVRDRRARAAIFTWGTLQALARVYTVAHFTSDVIMGSALGFGTGTLVFFLLSGPTLRAPAQEATAT